MEIPLKERLVKYLQNQHGWVSGFQLQELTMQKAHQTGKTCSRRLQEAVQENLLEVRYIRGAAQFRALPKRNLEREFNDYFDSLPVPVI